MENEATMVYMEESSHITKEKLQELTDTLESYKKGKANLSRRVIAAEDFWKLRHWENIRKHEPGEIEPSSGWITNSILAKHSDAMDAYPEAIMLAREPNDEQTAKTLSEIIPVVLEQNEFRQVWSDVWYDKLKGGTGIYSVVWDKNKLGGIGDISIKCVDILEIFWKPGVKDIQDSPYVFYTHAENEDALKATYPQLANKDSLGDKTMVPRYTFDDNIDMDGMVIVIDCYYKENGAVHLCQYVGDAVLYSSKDDAATAERGLYDHGKYPFVFDALWPEKGYPNCGFGYVDLDKDSQVMVDLLNSAFSKNALFSSIPRYFKRKGAGINTADLMDLTKTIVEVPDGVDDSVLRRIEAAGIPGYALDFLQLKIDEMKEVGGNRDVNNGGGASGVTAASAIAALQEAGNGLSRDMIEASYRAFRKVVEMVIDLIRQFYDIPRQFRITGQFNQPAYVTFDNSGMVPQSQGGIEYGVDMGMRTPIFDIEVEVQKESSYTKEGYNQLAIQLFQMGIFNPQMADQSMLMLDMMDFKGKDDLQRKIAQFPTLLQQLQLYQQMALSLAQKYEPEIAQGLAQNIVGQQGGAPQTAINPTEVGTADTGEDKRVQRARENARGGAMPR